MSIITLGQEVLAQSGEGAPTWRPVVMGKNGMVAAEHPLQALAGLRDATAIARFSAPEQDSCKQLWAEVQSLLAN